MKTVGKQLQEGRLEKKWTPEMASRETKIRVDRLIDLESDNFSNFSNPTYARGFVRTYARALHLDEYRLLRQLDQKLPEWDGTLVNNTGVMYIYDVAQVPWVVKKDWRAHVNPVIDVIFDRSSFWKTDRCQVISLGADNAIKPWDGLLQEDWLGKLSFDFNTIKYCPLILEQKLSYKHEMRVTADWNKSKL